MRAAAKTWTPVTVTLTDWQQIRDRAIVPAERAAYGTASLPELNWLRDAWRQSQRDGEMVTVALTGPLARVLAGTCKPLDAAVAERLHRTLARAGLLADTPAA